MTNETRPSWNPKAEFDYSCFSHKARRERFEKTFLPYEIFVEKVKEDRKNKPESKGYTLAIRMSTDRKIAAVELFYADGDTLLDDTLVNGIKGAKSTQCFPFENLDAQLSLVESDLPGREVDRVWELRNRQPGTNYGTNYLVATMEETK
ncbi:hypothetical protein J4402_05620 [Candidatus Pacearchaeota archaeon]|nr:hypothetical protein [Candidatus Pacearchaeota archaeon]